MCVHNKTILTNRGTTGEDEQDEMKNEKKADHIKCWARIWSNWNSYTAMGILKQFGKLAVS